MKIKRIELLHTCNKLYRLFASFGIRDDSLEKVSKIIPETLFRWVSCEGHPGLKRFKVMSNSLIRQILGLKAEFPFSSKYKRIRLRILLSSRKSKLHSIYWISVLSLFRLIKLEPVEDTSTITDSFKGSLLGLIFNMRSLYHASKSFSRRLKSPLENWTCHWKWHISAAAGPNGTVAYTRFLHDLYASRKEGVLIKSLFLLYVLPVCNRQEAFDSLKDAIFQSFTDENIAKDDPIHSRLAFLSDSGGKTRIIALVDILSQSVLKLIHQRVNSLLRKLSSDGTFDQDAQRKRVQEWTNSK